MGIRSPPGLAAPLVETQQAFCDRPSFSSLCLPVCENILRRSAKLVAKLICIHFSKHSKQITSISAHTYRHKTAHKTLTPVPVGNTQMQRHKQQYTLAGTQQLPYKLALKRSYWSGSIVSILTLSFWYTVRQLGQRAGKLCLAASSLMRCQHHKHMLYPQVQN